MGLEKLRLGVQILTKLNSGQGYIFETITLFAEEGFHKILVMGWDVHSPLW